MVGMNYLDMLNQLKLIHSQIIYIQIKFECYQGKIEIEIKC